MIDRFQILIEGGRSGDETQRLSVRLGENYLTSLIRRGSNEPDHCLEAPPLPLAFWFVDNWWRIRCEPAPSQRALLAQWRLAHHLPSVGAGYPWPNVSLWGEGDRCAVAVHADAGNLQPSLRFLAEPALEYVASSTAETAIDSFIDQVLQHAGAECDGLDVEYKDLREERDNPSASSRRRLEALLGFDPDGAPEGVVSNYETLAKQYGFDGIGEAALAHQGERSVYALQEALEAAETSKVILRTADDVTSTLPLHRCANRPPWQLALDAARELRQQLRIPSGPVRNPRLSEVLGINVDRLATRHRSSTNIPYALRLRTEAGDGNRLALRSNWSHGRRFELCRSLGDVVWSGNDALGPLSTAKSERQKFQRAFAQEFLCPFEDLQAYIPAQQPADDDIHAAARHFHVSERLIQTTLVNHNIIDRKTFEQMVEAA